MIQRKLRLVYIIQISILSSRKFIEVKIFMHIVDWYITKFVKSSVWSKWNHWQKKIKEKVLAFWSNLKSLFYSVKSRVNEFSMSFHVYSPQLIPALGTCISLTWVATWGVCAPQFSKSNRVENISLLLVPDLFSKWDKHFETFGHTFAKKYALRGPIRGNKKTYMINTY